MFESDGITPEPTQDSNTQQYLTLAEAVVKASELETRLSQANTTIDNLWSRVNKLQAILDGAKEGIEEVLAGDTNAQETFEDFKTPFELLGVELAVERQITITATWTLTIKTAREYLNEWDFATDIESDNSEIEILSQDVELDISE